MLLYRHLPDAPDFLVSAPAGEWQIWEHWPLLFLGPSVLPFSEARASGRETLRSSLVVLFRAVFFFQQIVDVGVVNERRVRVPLTVCVHTHILRIARPFLCVPLLLRIGCWNFSLRSFIFLSFGSLKAAMNPCSDFEVALCGGS